MCFERSLTAVWLAEKPASTSLTYGYHRYEVLGAVTSVFLIWFIAGILVYEAIQRVIHPVAVDGKRRWRLVRVSLAILPAVA